MQAAIAAGDTDNKDSRTPFVLGRRNSLLLPDDCRPIGAPMLNSDRFPALAVIGSASLASASSERFAVICWVVTAPDAWPSSDPNIAHGPGASN